MSVYAGYRDAHLAFHRMLAEAGGVRALARKLKLSAAYVSDMKLGRRAYGPGVLKAMGFKLIREVKVSYVRIR